MKCYCDTGQKISQIQVQRHDSFTKILQKEELLNILKYCLQWTVSQIIPEKEQGGGITEGRDGKEDFRDFARGKEQQNLMQPLFFCDSYDFSLCVFFLLASSPGPVSTVWLLLVYSSVRDLDVGQKSLTVHKFECVFVGTATAQNYILGGGARGLGVSSLKR